MRIGIDARFYGIAGKGLGRYTQKLIENLEKQDSKNQYFVFLNEDNFDEYKPLNPNFHKVLADCPWYSFLEQIKMPLLLNKARLDLVHFPHFNVPFLYSKKFIVTIHDLILLEFPTLRGTTLSPIFYKIKFLAYRFIIWLAIRRAQKIITVSNFTKKELLRHYEKDLKLAKIEVIYEAGNENDINKEKNPKNNLEILKRYGIIKPYLLYVGNAYPHKNLERLVLAFSRLNSDKKYQLVLVGKIDYFYQRLRSIIREKNISDIVFTGQLNDVILDLVYKESIAYVFASLYEGFGIPPLEAMNKGVPVVSSDHACMKEILGESAYYFDGKDEASMIEAMKTVLENEETRKDLIEKGFAQIKKYSWQTMTQKTKKIYEEINEKR